LKFAPIAIPAMALLQQLDAQQDILIEPAACSDRSSGAFRTGGVRNWGVQSGRKNQPACGIITDIFPVLNFCFILAVLCYFLSCIALLWPVITDGVAWSVGQSVCLS